MVTTSDPTTTRKLGPIAEGNLQQLEACVSRSQVDNVCADANRKALVELARYFECFEGHSRDAKEDLARLVADTYWQVRTPSLPEQAAATEAAIDAVLAANPVVAAIAAAMADTEPEAPQAVLPDAEPQPPADVVVPTLVELVNRGMTATEAMAARKALAAPGQPPASGKARASWMPRYAEAREAAKAKRRPASYPVPTTAADRKAYIANVQRTLPGASAAQALEVAAWCDGLPVTRQVWARTWAEVAFELAAEALAADLAAQPEGPPAP